MSQFHLELVLLRLVLPEAGELPPDVLPRVRPPPDQQAHVNYGYKVGSIPLTFLYGFESPQLH